MCHTEHWLQCWADFSIYVLGKILKVLVTLSFLCKLKIILCNIYYMSFHFFMLEISTRYCRARRTMLYTVVMRTRTGWLTTKFNRHFAWTETNHLKIPDFLFLCHSILCRNGSVIVLFDLFFAQWVSDENVKEELIQGIEANTSSQLVTFRIDLNSIDITGICEHYLISLNH